MTWAFMDFPPRRLGLEECTALPKKNWPSTYRPATAKSKMPRRHVVLSHVPPQGIKLDRTHFFQHVGSSALREFVEKTQPALVVCGHVHESRGVDMIGSTTVVNCGPAGSGYYAIAEIDDQVRVDLHRC